jgi:ATP-binding cassette subfamily B protein
VHGKIVEYGTHEELLARNGYYTSLHDKQLLEEELETA